MITIEEQVITLTKKKLIESVEYYVHIDGLSYLEALLYVAEQHDVDPSDLAPLITGTLKDKLECDARRLHYLPKIDSVTHTLDI